MSAQFQIAVGAVAAATIDMIEAGIAWASGRAGRIDLIEAHKWFNLAASRGERRAITHREEIASEMTREEIAKAQRAAREWLATIDSASRSVDPCVDAFWGQCATRLIC